MGMRKTVESQTETGVVIRLIEAEGEVKALVLDLDRVDGRLLYIGHGLNADQAYMDACEFVSSLGRGGTGWH